MNFSSLWMKTRRWPNATTMTTTRMTITESPRKRSLDGRSKLRSAKLRGRRLIPRVPVYGARSDRSCRSMTISARLILPIPAIWIGIRMTTSLLCAPVKLRNRPPKSHGSETQSIPWYDLAIYPALCAVPPGDTNISQTRSPSNPAPTRANVSKKKHG